jgi:hypothetical protein
MANSMKALQQTENGSSKQFRTHYWGLVDSFSKGNGMSMWNRYQHFYVY